MFYDGFKHNNGILLHISVKFMFMFMFICHIANREAPLKGEVSS